MGGGNGSQYDVHGISDAIGSGSTTANSIRDAIYISIA